jgi:hypothetical protein
VRQQVPDYIAFIVGLLVGCGASLIVSAALWVRTEKIVDWAMKWMIRQEKDRDKEEGPGSGMAGR